MTPPIIPSVIERPLIGNRFLLNVKIGAGNNGDVFVATDTTNNEEVAIKLAKGGHLESESRRYLAFIHDYQEQNHGCSPRGFPSLIWSGHAFRYYCIAYDLLGPTLDDLRRFCDGRFTEYTTFFLGEQILDRLRVLHQTGYTHGSIKPANIAMGLATRCSKVYLIDFGSMHTTETPRIHSSTSLWKSIHRHNGFPHTMRDDLESWLYMMAYLLHGSLLWNENTSKEDILRMKIQDTPNWMETLKLGSLWKYVRGLEATMIPNYQYLKKLLRQQSNRFPPQAMDWIVKFHKQDKSNKRP